MDKFWSWNHKLNIFEIALRALIILLPFTTIISVFSEQRLGIPGVTYYKEILLILWLGYLAWSHLRGKLQITWWWIDLMILIYIIYLTTISFGTTGIRGILYGGRYDFEFLIAFWMTYHGASLLSKPLSFYLKLFLYSSGIMLILSWLLKFPFSEELLLHFWYSGSPSAWQFGNAPPIFHGIDGANVRRFQGILDWPNTMGAFLIMFSWWFAYYIREKKPWYFVNGLILLGLLIMIIYTYSRSALIGVLVGYMIIIVSGMVYIFRFYRKQFLSILIWGILLVGILSIQYAGTLGAILGRSGSTKGHLERMVTSFERFKAHPFGQGLGSSWPGYRHTQELEWLTRAEIEEKDRFYIPESWYIQQFVEWGIVGGLVFLILMFIFFIRLYKKQVILGAMFVGIGVMNLFLHTFESSPFVLLFFLLIGLTLAERYHGNRIYRNESV
jgi:hypothetical protein